MNKSFDLTLAIGVTPAFTVELKSNLKRNIYVEGRTTKLPIGNELVILPNREDNDCDIVLSKKKILFR